MADIVAALCCSHAPGLTGRPVVAKPEQRERLHASFAELRRRLAAARPDLLVMFANDHIQNFTYANMPAFCVGLAETYDAPGRLNKLLTSLARRHASRATLTDPDLAGRELAEDERAALQRGDVDALYHLGANPYLIRRVFRGNFRR